jgi:peptidoglycan/LPS O-acetylase OafA/YrhL
MAPPVVAPPPGHPRFALFDSLRAVAALGVLVSHAGFLAGASQGAWYGSLVAQGSVGVTVFFDISGFLLYRPFLAADLEGRPRARLRDYARRRVLRIVPAYWLALTVIAAVLALPGVLGGDWWHYYGLVQVYDRYTVGGGLVAAWSLCIEVSFYAYLPVHAVLMRRAGAGRAPAARLRMEVVALVVLAGASLIARGISLASGGSILDLTLVTTFFWFALGMALAVASVAGTPGRALGAVARHPGACWAAAGAVYLVLAVVLRTRDDGVLRYSQGQWMVQHVLSGVLAICLVAPAALGQELGGWPRRVLAWRTLAWLGLVSYGIYLWQGGWVAWLTDHGARDWIGSSPFVVLTVATAAGTVACAALSYYLLERPLMRLKYRARTPRPAPRDTEVVAGSARAPVPRSAPGSPR